jgi:uncharacterized membrane protein YkvA (DUF1232 family)
MSDEQRQSSEGEVEPRRRTGDPAFWRELLNQARLVYHLMRDPDVPFYLKLLPLAAIAYVIFPADLAPDLVPVIGQVDDLMALIVGAKVFVEMAPPHVVERYQPSIVEPVEDPLQDAIIIDAEHAPIEETQNGKGRR